MKVQNIKVNSFNPLQIKKSTTNNNKVGTNKSSDISFKGIVLSQTFYSKTGTSGITVEGKDFGLDKFLCNISKIYLKDNPKKGAISYGPGRHEVPIYVADAGEHVKLDELPEEVVFVAEKSKPEDIKLNDVLEAIDNGIPQKADFRPHISYASNLKRVSMKKVEQIKEKSDECEKMTPLEKKVLDFECALEEAKIKNEEGQISAYESLSSVLGGVKHLFDTQKQYEYLLDQEKYYSDGLFADEEHRNFLNTGITKAQETREDYNSDSDEEVNLSVMLAQLKKRKVDKAISKNSYYETLDHRITHTTSRLSEIRAEIKEIEESEEFIQAADRILEARQNVIDIYHEHFPNLC